MEGVYTTIQTDGENQDNSLILLFFVVCFFVCYVSVFVCHEIFTVIERSAMRNLRNIDDKRHSKTN
jgi:hypothetical protein